MVVLGHTAGCNYVKRSCPDDGILDGIQPNIAEESPKNYNRQYQGTLAYFGSDGGVSERPLPLAPRAVGPVRVPTRRRLTGWLS